MSKNIIVLTGSPRKGGNSDALADAFIRGASAEGHNISKFESAFKPVQGCRACGTCWSKGTACSFRDSFSELEPLVEAADVIVFSTPLYWFNVPAQLKAAIDKLNAYTVEACKKHLKIKESVFMICGADDEKAFTGAIETYKSMAGYMKWENRGLLVVPGVSAKGDINRTEALKTAEILGSSI